MYGLRDMKNEIQPKQLSLSLVMLMHQLFRLGLDYYSRITILILLRAYSHTISFNIVTTTAIIDDIINAENRFLL